MWLRLRQVALVAAELEPVVDDLRAVLGLEVGHRDPGVDTFGLENAILPVGTQFLEVVAPVRGDTAAGRYLARRGGDGGYMVITQCDDHTPRRQRVQQLGIRTVLEFDQPRYRCMQLHPADTGGSFLEIDWQEGGHDSGGPWAPAGEHWRDAVRTDVVRAISGVEIQDGEPARVAARWSEIIETPVADIAGHPTVQLENAALRFVPAGDGRGDGLGGVDVVATDPARARAVAADRGLPVDGDVVVICGTRFRLS